MDPFIPSDRTRYGVVLPPEPRGRIPHHLSAADRMRPKLRTERESAGYAWRTGTVELVFGQINQAGGLGQPVLRAIAKVRLEWRLICTGNNQLKLFAA